MCIYIIYYVCIFHTYIYIYIHTHTHIYIYIYIYIVIHRQTVSFCQNSSVWRDRLDSGSWDRNQADCNANPRFYHSATRKPTQAKEIYTLMYHICFVYIYPLNGYNSFEEPCFTLVATITSLARELKPTGVGEHIFSHPQTDLFRSIRTLQCCINCSLSTVIIYIYIYIYIRVCVCECK